MLAFKCQGALHVLLSRSCYLQGMEASKGTKVEGISSPQLELLKDISGAFRPGMLCCPAGSPRVCRHMMHGECKLFWMAHRPDPVVPSQDGHLALQAF